MRDGWFTVEEIGRDSFVISEYGHWEEVHCYLLLGDREALLIDTGLGVGDIGAEIDRITELPVWVVTTHYHWDHMGGHKSFDRIMIHEEERAWMEKQFPLSLSVVKEKLMREPFRKEPPPSFNLDDYSLYKGIPSRVFSEDCELDLGNRLVEVLHTPGHSPGHLSFYEREQKALYCGDLFYKGDIYVNYPSTDPEKYYRSVQKLAGWDIELIYPGHHDLPLKAADFYSYADFLRANRDKLHHGTGRLALGPHSLLL